MNKVIQKIILFVSLSSFLYGTCIASDREFDEISSKSSGEIKTLKRSRDDDKEERQVKPRLDDILIATSVEIPEVIRKQTFGMPTLDAAFKYLLHDEAILLEFIKLFGETPTITSAELLDQSLNPVKELKKARSVLHKEETRKFFNKIEKANEEKVKVQICNTKDQWQDVSKGARILKKLSAVYSEIKEAIPDQERNSQLDIVCKLSNDDFVLVEVQVALQDYWDDRALAYAGAFYGNQLKKGGEWKDLKKVIAINILGGGNEEAHYWKDSPNELMRHYQFVSEIEGKKHTIDSLQLIQYNVMFAKLDTIENSELRDWIEFLQQAHKKTDTDLEKVKTEIVKQAYERIRIKTMPEKTLQQYIDQYKEYEKYSLFITKEKEASHKQGVEDGIGIGREKGSSEKAKTVALRMLSKGMQENDIAEVTDLTPQQIQELKSSLK